MRSGRVFALKCHENAIHLSNYDREVPIYTLNVHKNKFNSNMKSIVKNALDLKVKYAS